MSHDPAAPVRLILFATLCHPRCRCWASTSFDFHCRRIFTHRQISNSNLLRVSRGCINKFETVTIVSIIFRSIVSIWTLRSKFMLFYDILILYISKQDWWCNQIYIFEIIAYLCRNIGFVGCAICLPNFILLR